MLATGPIPTESESNHTEDSRELLLQSAEYLMDYGVRVAIWDLDDFLLKTTPYFEEKIKSKIKLYEWLDKKYPRGVQFSEEGFPDFSPYIYVDSRGKKYSVELEQGFTERPKDFEKANILSGLAEAKTKGDPIPGFTWHHCEDGKTLQLVPRDLHEAIRHTGGYSISVQTASIKIQVLRAVGLL